MKYQIKSDKGYYSRSMSTGKAVFYDSSEMGYTFTKEEAEKMLDKLEKETGKDLEIVEYKSYYDDGGLTYEVDMNEVRESARRFADSDWSNERLLKEYNDSKLRLSEFNAGLIKPSKVIGGGYKSSAIARKLAKKWLLTWVAQYKMALEMRGVMAKGGQIYNFDVVLYNNDENYTIKQKKEYKVKASNRSTAYDKAKKKYPKPYFVELHSVDTYADGGSVSDTVAMIILKQLGGINKLVAMTGAYNFVDLGDGVSFKIKNQRANYIKITLNSMDLYDLEVGRIRGTTYKVVATHKDVYFDQLKPLIEKSTGMYLSLFAKGGKVKREQNDVFDPYVPPTPEEKAAKQQKQMEMAKMAMMFAKDGAEITDLNIDKLDMYERMRYDDMIKKGISKEDALNILINDVGEFYSQLSPELRKYAAKRKFAQGGIMDEMREAKKILGEEKWNRMNQDDRLEATKYLIRKGKIEGSREEYEYDTYPYAKGGRVRFQDKVDAISDRLEGTKVPKRLIKDYGVTYDKKESEMAAKRIVGSMIKKGK